jgi:hypothetical protein
MEKILQFFNKLLSWLRTNETVPSAEKEATTETNELPTIQNDIEEELQDTIKETIETEKVAIVEEVVESKIQEDVQEITDSPITEIQETLVVKEEVQEEVQEITDSPITEIQEILVIKEEIQEEVQEITDSPITEIQETLVVKEEVQEVILSDADMPADENSIIQEKLKPVKTEIMAGEKAGTLYALCVGINDYQYVPKLGGCVPDATNVYNYLEKSCANTDFKFDAVVLTDAQATKDAITSTFLSHLGKAKAGDIAVFYFSGHGAEEDADEVFWGASQKKTLNTMVAYDSRSPEGIPDIADKEMRYMISKMTYSEDKDASLPHFVLITDSCHSGGATRDVGEMTARLTEKGGPRTWDKFIFADKFSKDDVANATSLKAIMPQGQHVHFSSCEGTELAYEVKGSGVFTGTMLEVLSRTSGKITYSDLHNRIRYYIKGRFPQSPTIHAVEGGAVNAMEMNFLGGASEQKGLRANVIFNTKLRKWILDMGAIQGIPATDFGSVEVSVMDHDDAFLTKAIINTVTPDNCYIDVDEDKVDIRESYSAEIKGIYREPIGVFLDMESDASMSKIKARFEEEGDDLTDATNLKIVDTFAGADYMIRVNEAHFEISEVSDIFKRPIVQQQSTDDDGAPTTVLSFMKYIARYNFVMGLDNPKTRLVAGDKSKPPAGIEVYRVHDDSDRSQDELVPADENGIVEVNDGDLLSIKTVNNTRRNKLFFALCSDSTFEEKQGVFGIDAVSLGDSAQEMLPEEELWLFEMQEFDAFHADHVLDFKFPETRMNFKLIASTETFSPRELSHDPLPFPFKYDKEETPGSRGLKRRSRPDSADWCTYNLHIVIKNPDGK